MQKVELLPDTEISIPVFTGVSDHLVQIKYESEQNKTNQQQTNFYPKFQLK
jgi:hypothetical protein